MRAFVWIAGLALAGVLASQAYAAAPDPEICPVHGIKMERKVMRLVYGMPSKAEFDEMEAAKTQFLHGKDYALAGCVVKPDKTVEGYVCPKCVEAREAWLKVHKRF